MRNKRNKIWINRFQTALSLRITLYFVLYQLAVWFFVLIARQASAAIEQILGLQPGPYLILFAAATLLYVGFLFVYDAVKFAHRIVGPLYRFRQTIKAVAAGEEVELVRLRQDDMLQELRDDLNEMLKALEQRGALTLKEPAAAPARGEQVPA